MWICCVALIISSFYGWLEAPHFLISTSQKLHQQCLDWLSLRSSVPHISQALICGKSLPASEKLQQLRASGLVHYFVVSGAHVLALEKCFKLLPIKEKWRSKLYFVFLLFYAGICLFKAPVCRALFQHIIQKISLNQQWNLNKADVQLFAFSSCVAFFPSLWGSLSLAMSASICVALHITTRTWLKSIFVYTVIFIFISGFGSPHPVTLFVNFIFSPIFAIIYFPITLLEAAFSFLKPLTSSLWSALFFLLDQFQLQALEQQARLNSYAYWLVLSALFLLLIIKIHWKRSHEIKDFL